MVICHVLTGANAVFSFHDPGKKSVWAGWMANPEVTNAFIALLLQPTKSVQRYFFRLSILILVCALKPPV